MPKLNNPVLHYIKVPENINGNFPFAYRASEPLTVIDAIAVAPEAVSGLRGPKGAHYHPLYAAGATAAGFRVMKAGEVSPMMTFTNVYAETFHLAVLSAGELPPFLAFIQPDFGQ